ncbi:MAG: T9SS type A sorting domain-containing protein, partial [Bacteroidota bacterium]
DGNTYNTVASGTPFNGPSPSATTSYTLTSIADNNGCVRTSGITGASATLTINTAPIITTQPDAPAAACSSSGMQTLTVAATGAGLAYSWRKDGTAVTNGGVFSGQGTPTLTLTNPLVANAGSYDVVISGTCPPSPVTSNAVTVSVNPLPQGSISGNTICAGNQSQFTFTATTGTGPYTLIIGGSTYTNVVSGSPFNGPSPSATTAYTLTSITDANGCIRTTGFSGSTATITVSQQPTAAAGGNVSLCQGTSHTIPTGEASSANGTRLWTHNGAGNFNGGLSTSTLLLPTYTAAADDAGNTVTLTLTVSNPPCTDAVATYTINVSATPTASAGGSQTICQNGTATVPSATATNGAILWTHNGSGQFADDGTGNPGVTSTLLTPTYVAAAGDGGFTRTLTLTVSNAPCPNATATHTVVIEATPTANAGSNGSICQNGTFTVTGASSSNGTRVWTHNGTGSFNGGNATSTLLAPTYTADAGDAGNTVVLTLTVSNSPCSDAVSTTNVSVGTAPTASVSGSAPHAISCGTGSVAVSGASAANNSSVSWSYSAAVGSSANGTLLNANTLTPTYVCDPNDFGTIILTMTAFATAPCTDNATATFVINVKPRPTVAVTLGPNVICNDGNGVARKLTVSNSEANTTYLWSPATDLYVDAAYTIPYTNQNVTEVWAVPFVTTTYTVTATNNTSLCTTPASLPTTLTVCNNLTDVICGASDIAVNSTGAWTNITLIGSTASAGNPCAIVERDVYRRVQVPASGELHVTTAAGTNSTASLNIQRTLVSIHYAPGGTCTTSPSIACNSTGAADNHSYVYATGLTPGEYAWIRIAKAKANVSDPNTVAQELRINVAPGLTWTGTASTAFTNSSNWLNGDATSVTVPDASKSVLIRQVTNAPVVSSNEQIRGLIMSSGAGLSINTANTLSVSRYLQTANNTVGGLGWTVLNGSFAQTINTTVRFNNLRVNNAAGVNITAATRVGGLDLQQGVVTTNNNLSLLSEAALTGYVNNFSTGYTGSLSGNINIERRVVLASATAGVDHYLASPVDMVGTVSSNYSDDFPVVGNPANYVYNSNPNFTQPSTFPSTWTWDETLTNSNTPGWTGAGGTTLVKGQGFSAKVTSTRIIDISGVANNGSINRTLTYTDNGLNLVGNPYPSSINFNTFAAANSAVILPVLYIWNPASNSYASYNGSIWVNNPAGALASDVIGHSQSFFVFAKPAIAPSGTVNFTNTMRTISQPANFFSAPEGLIRLEVSSNGHTDEAVVITDAEATENYDEQVDARKLLNAMNPNILAFTLSADNTPLAINAMDNFSAEQIIPVQVIAPTSGEVNIKLNLADLQERYENIYLEDATLGTFVDLKARGSYTAKVSAGNSGSRFFLHFAKPSIASVANELGVYAANSSVFANLPSQSNGTIEVIDLVGKTIYTSNFSGKSGRVAFEIPNAVYGSYIVKLTSNGKIVNQKVLLTE